MNNLLLTIAGVMLVIVTIFHAVMGQRLLITPMLQQRAGMMDETMPRTIIQFSWQAQTLLMFLPALYLFLISSGLTDGSAIMVFATGLSFIILGLINAVMTRMRHPGGYLLGGAGIITLLALYI